MVSNSTKAGTGNWKLFANETISPACQNGAAALTAEVRAGIPGFWLPAGIAEPNADSPRHHRQPSHSVLRSLASRAGQSPRDRLQDIFLLRLGNEKRHRPRL